MLAEQPQLFYVEPRPEPCPKGCVLAIVGSVILEGDPDAEEAIRRTFDEHQPSWFVSGGAIGVDKMAEDEGDRRGMGDKKTVHLPEQKGWFWYKKRDLLIAQDAAKGCLVRIYSGQARTWGSGWTAREAEKLGARVTRIQIGEGPAKP